MWKICGLHHGLRKMIIFFKRQQGAAEVTRHLFSPFRSISCFIAPCVPLFLYFPSFRPSCDTMWWPSGAAPGTLTPFPPPSAANLLTWCFWRVQILDSGTSSSRGSLWPRGAAARRTQRRRFSRVNSTRVLSLTSGCVKISLACSITATGVHPVQWRWH